MFAFTQLLYDDEVDESFL